MIPSSLLPSQSMAIMCSSCKITIMSGKIHRSRIRTVMAIKSIQPPNEASTCLMKPYLSIQVFEDSAKGIVCYRDETGEMVCEGYDEGPRYSREPSDNIYHRRCREMQISSSREEMQISSSREERLLKILEEHN